MKPRSHVIAIPLLALIAAGAFWGCTAPTGSCTDPFDINAGLDANIETDQKQPDAMATLTGSALIAYPCDAPAEKLTLRKVVLYEVDETTPIADLDLQFEGGTVTLEPGACSGLGNSNVKVKLTSSGVVNSKLATHCGSQLWVAGNIERAGCANGTVKKFGLLAGIGCK